MTGKPVALANWKLKVTVAESLTFLHRFRTQARELLQQVQVGLCPPHTA